MPSSLTPPQLAVNLGERDMVLAVLRREAGDSLDWFGEMSMHKIPLQEIDSSEEGANQVMELICMADAALTQQLLGDDFLGGVFYQLFVEKWQRWAKYFHWLNLVFFLLYIVLLIDHRPRPRHAQRPPVRQAPRSTGAGRSTRTCCSPTTRASSSTSRRSSSY